MMRKRKTVVAKRITPKVMTGIPKLFGILNDPLGNQVESKLMEREEADQRKYDRFWGQDKDFQDREVERFYMAKEDAASMANEKWFETVEIHKRWDDEYQRNLWFENRSQAKYKEIERREYLKFVNSSLSSDEVINFVWARKDGSAGSQQPNGKEFASSAQQQGLIFSDLSAINREVALSLPTTVGALHMSVHMDGLQQSRAIVDGASSAFKQTLRRINNQTALDGDASQPFRNNALAAAIIKKKGLQESTVEEGQRVAVEEEAPRHLPAVEGHNLHKWDQELMLQLAFMGLDKGGKGYLTAEEVSAVSFDARTHALLSFTVFWANIKKRNWSFFQNMGSSVPTHARPHHQGGQQPGGIVMSDWMGAAHGLSLESAVPLRHIRTQDEHLVICEGAVPKNGALRVENRGAGAANVFSGLPEREHRVSRLLEEGDCVWALHHGGVVWLPAVVRAIHHQPPVLGTARLSAPGHGSTVAYSAYRYDLWFPLSQKDLVKARSTMASRQLLALPSQQQPSQAAPAAGAGEGAGVCLPPKPLTEERKVCAYAFDLVDSGGEGIVPLQRLVQCLQSVEFSRVVATSLALSVIFHGGSQAHDVAGDAASPTSFSSKLPLGGRGTGSDGPSKMSAAGTADIPSLLPVFIDTFSAPAPEPEEEEIEIEVEVEGEEEKGEHGGVESSTLQVGELSLRDGAEVGEGADNGGGPAAGDAGAGSEGEGEGGQDRLRGIAFQSSSDSAGEVEGSGPSVPTDQAHQATQEMGEEGGKSPLVLRPPSRDADEKNAPKKKTKKLVKVRRPKQPQQQQAATPAAAVDWISKLDFLEFCQAVVDVKRYSVRA